MNKQNPPIERFLLMMVMAGAWFYFFPKLFPQTPPTPPRPALTLSQAFQGIDPAQGPALSPTTAVAEVSKLQANITKNEQDPLAYWSRLRVGLIQQYVLHNLESKERNGGFLGMGAKVKYFPTYDDIVNHAAGDPIEAQALYQSGDLAWRQSTQKNGQPSQEAATALEALVHKGRGSSTFLDHKIFVPTEIDPAKVPLDAVPAEGFKQVKVRDLHGTLENPNPQGLLDRVNQFYSTSAYFTLFDSVSGFFGANPKYSYGLAVLFFAVVTRMCLQPLTKRQYDSMKGMAVIAPEMKKIQEKYKGKTESDAQVKMMQEIRALQKRHGVNPMMGCGYALIQMPIFFVFVYPLIQHYEPKMELVGASFLWISSLARPDIPLLMLYGISMFFSFRLSSTPPTDEMQATQQKMMSFFLPVIFPFFILTYPSAFTMYWMTYNAVSTFFQWRMMKAADPSKNIIKTLMGTDMSALNPTADAVPGRPKNESKALQTGQNSLVATGTTASGGATNGTSTNGAAVEGASRNGSRKNGKAPQSAQNGSVMSPFEGGNNTKKKKR